MRFVALNHWYPEAWEAWKASGGPPMHGTADYWDTALRSLGHESETLVLNDCMAINIFKLAEASHPDVAVSLEVGRFPSSAIRQFVPNAKIVAFCSHHAEDSALKGFDCVFSSFPWMPDYCKSIGVRCEYLPLAFGKSVLEHVKTDGPRDIPVAFIGGLGSRTWNQGTRTMAAIAEAVPDFAWYGYCQGALSDLPTHLQAAYRGPAYGIEMYRLLARTKIMLNRHGEIARGFGNNCRQYEAGGMGCCLLTDDAGELFRTAIEYSDAENAIELIVQILNDDAAEAEGAFLQELVLANHTFEHRATRFLEVVESL